MRIKSYFAPSVQSAIALARKEFGDVVTLVTSHVAAPENRTFGEYEVVFAIEESTAAAPTPAPEPQKEAGETPPAPFSAFQELLLQAVSARPSVEEGLPKKLADVRCLLIELGIEPGMVIRLMGIVEQLAGVHSGQSKPDHSIQTLEEHISTPKGTADSPLSGPSAAELLFAESVGGGTNQFGGSRF